MPVSGSGPAVVLDADVEVSEVDELHGARIPELARGWGSNWQRV